MPSSLTLQATHGNPDEWLWVAGALALLLGVATLLVFAGRAQGGWTPPALVRKAGSSLERLTGLPAWSASGILLQTWALLVAGIGFYWDVAWHIDLGRDTALFTAPHILILIGLMGFAVAGSVSSLYATLEDAPSAWRIGRIRIPRGAAALIVIGLTAGLGFPLDELWHSTYGIDVTMWSPTHLMMIGAAAVSPFAAWLLLGEAPQIGVRPRVRAAIGLQVAVGCLLALASLQLEFDDGVPQWQALYQPVLVGVCATLPLVAARIALGRGAAVAAAAAFVAARCVVALLIGPGLGHVTPHFPLYLGIAVCVEAGFALAAGRGLLRAVVVAGGLAGTAGLATEWGFSHVFGREPWQTSMLPSMWLPALATMAAALVGAAFGLAVSGRRIAIPRTVMTVAGVALVAALVIPLPRNGLALPASVITSPAGPKQVAVDRYGQASLFQMVRVEVDVAPQSDAAFRRADWFRVTSWQGGGRLAQALTEVAPGRWRAPQAVPTGAAWKTIILLGRGDVVAALPVALPADPAVGLSAIPLEPARTQTFVPSSQYLMRESHSGASWPAILAYTAWLLMVAAWLGFLALGAMSLARLAAGSNPLRRPVPQHVLSRLGKRASLHVSR
jgi:hypothetical protein